MSSPASIKKHPLHPMLVALPLGLWVFAFVCDLVHVSSGNTVWATVALYAVGGGIAGALIAALPGLIDYLSIDEAEMRRIATWHLFLNVGAMLIFAVDLWLRFHLAAESKLPMLISLCGVALVGFGGWLGGEMVYVRGMAVEPVEKLSGRKSQRPQLRRTG
jgi:uncharacterized membrane protein